MINRLHVAALMLVIVLGALAQAQTFTTLYSFTGSTDGAFPYAGVIQDESGNLYSTTWEGGDLSCGYNSSGCGVVFMLNSSGTEAVLYSFTGGSDGRYPFAPLVRDSNGNIYGTTPYGGNTNCSYGCGVVFKIDSAGNETVLHSFAGGSSDGCYPFQGLTSDKKGNLYGTTADCGSSSEGTIFKLDSADNVTILHNFAGGSSDGARPYYGHLIMDKASNLYGLTELGGSSHVGVMYKMNVKGKLTLLHSFAGGSSDGCYPYGSATMDQAGNLYGTTGACGSSSWGTVWKVSEKGTETILHNFTGGSDGAFPYAGVTPDSKGSVYGVAAWGGENGVGMVYELSPKGAFTVLHGFTGYDGGFPYGEVLRTAKGELFGTSSCLGIGERYGTVWSYMP